jgi:hypothetical protein
MIPKEKIAEWKVVLADAQLDPRGGTVLIEMARHVVPALLFERDELIALLRELEWAAVAGYKCPICRGRRPGTLSPYDLQDPGLDHSEGHAPDCRLARALADAR